MFWNQFQKFDLLAVWSLDVYLLRGNEFPVHMQCCPWMMAAQPIAISGHQFWDGQPAPRPELAPPPERRNVAPIDAGDGASDDSVLGPAGADGAGEAPQLPQSDSSSDSDSDLSCEYESVIFSDEDASVNISGHSDVKPALFQLAKWDIKHIRE
jgi:hypothetical protein